MKKQRKNRLTKIIASVTCVAMLGGLLALPVSAGTLYGSGGDGFNGYTCLGSQVANGATGTEPEATIMANTGFALRDGYYKDVASQLGITNAVSYAHNGYRAAEVRGLLDNDFAKTNKSDKYNQAIASSLIKKLEDYTGKSFGTLELGYLDDLTSDVQKKAQDAVAGSELVTLEVGTVDILLRPAVDVANSLKFDDLTSILSSSDLVELMNLLKSGDVNNPDVLIPIINKVMKNTKIQKAWNTGRKNAVSKFKTDLEASIKKINQLSGGKATIVLPTVYLSKAAFKKLSIKSKDWSKIANNDVLMSGITESAAAVNKIMNDMASKYSYVRVADISKVTTDKLLCPELGDNGYGFIADKIVAGLATPAGTSISKVTAGKKAFTVKWKKQASAEGYKIQYALKKNFSGKKTVTIKKNTTVKYTVKKLKSKKTYYVRICTYKDGYNSSWSGIKTVKTK